MKTKIVLLVICIFGFMSSNAQVQFGVRGGIDYSTMNVKLKYQYDSGIKGLLNYHLGLISDYRINDNFFLKTGLLLSKKGFNQEINDLDSTTKFRVTPYYIEVPVLGEFKFKVHKINLLIDLGPYFSYGIFGSVNLDIKSNKEDINYSENIRWSKYGYLILAENEQIVYNYGYSKIKRFDYGVNFELGLEYESLTLSVGYSYGLANLMWEYYTNEKMSNQDVRISLTYMFSSKKNK